MTVPVIREKLSNFESKPSSYSPAAAFPSNAFAFVDPNVLVDRVNAQARIIFAGKGQSSMVIQESMNKIREHLKKQSDPADGAKLKYDIDLLERAIRWQEIPEKSLSQRCQQKRNVLILEEIKQFQSLSLRNTERFVQNSDWYQYWYTQRDSKFGF